MTTQAIRSVLPMATNPIRVCARCGMRYDWRRSPSSSLKMTYCGTLCERADLGYTIEALLQYSAPKKREPGATTAPPVVEPRLDFDFGDDFEAVSGLMAA